MRTSSHINKSSTETKCAIDVTDLEDKTNNLCYFVIPISNGEFVQKLKERRSISHQQQLVSYQKRSTISTCPSDITSITEINNSDLLELHVSVVNKGKVIILTMYICTHVLLQKALSFKVELNCNNIYILDDSGTTTGSLTKTTGSISAVSLNTYAMSFLCMLLSFTLENV